MKHSKENGRNEVNGIRNPAHGSRKLVRGARRHEDEKVWLKKKCWGGCSTLPQAALGIYE